VPSSSSTADRKTLRVAAAVAAAAWAVVAGCVAVWPAIFRTWDARASDGLFALRARLECPDFPCRDRVVHVDLTYSGLRRLGNRQLTRVQFAQVAENLKTLGVAAQAFDIIFALQTSPEDDAALTDAARATGNMYVAMALQTAPPRPGLSETDADDAWVSGAAWDVQVEGSPEAISEGYAPLPTFEALTAAARGTGFINLVADPDGVFRRVPLVFRFRGRIIPSLPLRVACDYLGVTPQNVIVTPGRSVRLRNARAPGASRAGDVVIPIGPDNSYRLNFVGPWEAFTHEPLDEVWRIRRDPLAAAVLSDVLAGRIAVVSDLSAGAADIGPVPTDERYPLPGIHATVLDNILSGSFVRESSWPVRSGIELLLLGVVGIVMARISPRAIAPVAALLAALYLGLVVVVFLYLHAILGIIQPLLSVALATAAIGTVRFIAESRAKAVLRQSFQAYFPPQVVDRIVANPALMTLAGQRKELSILFSDIKSFTTRCERMTPEEVRRFLDVYFGSMVEIVFQHGGTVDKFIGDGLMVFFGDPEDQPDHALRAVRTAIAMQREVRRLSAELERTGSQGFQIRIGISTGPVVVGNMGSSRRLSYTVLGSDVNLAQRLEANARPGGVLISARTQMLIAAEIRSVPAGPIPIKGLTQPLRVYDVADDMLRE
jgi:adenylate cyclase